MVFGLGAFSTDPTTSLQQGHADSKTLHQQKILLFLTGAAG